MSWLPSWAGDLGAGAVVVIIVLAIITGRLVPRMQVKDVRVDLDTQLNRAEAEYAKRQAVQDSLMAEISHERDDWKAAFLSEQQRAGELSVQMGQLQESSRAVEQFIMSLPKGGGNSDG